MGERTRSWLQTGVILAALAVVVALGWRERQRFAPVGPGDRAPTYAAPSLAGDTVSLESLRGRVVLLNVWATWCAPCRWEMPAIERLHREYRDQGLEVVAASVDVVPGGIDALRAPDGPVARMVDELGLTFRILLDPAGEVQDRFGVAGLPTTFLIDRDGRIVERVLGPARWDEPPHRDRVLRVLGS
jgi:peroxiredoxin